MNMFRVISISGFLGIIAASIYLNRSGRLIGLVVEIRRIWFGDLGRDSKRLVYILGIASFIILTLTGFLPILFTGNSITGVALLLHVVVAPVFAVCIAIVGIIWADAHRFVPGELRNRFGLVTEKNNGKSSKKQVNSVGRKITFWLVLLLSLPVMVSMILSMYPLFGTHGQEVLLKLHGYSALFLVIACVASFCFGIGVKPVLKNQKMEDKNK